MSLAPGIRLGAGLQYDVAQDGRFLLNTVSDDASPITVVVNWTPDIQK